MFVGVANGEATFGDYDNDGDLDVLLNGGRSGGLGITQIYTNTCDLELGQDILNWCLQK